MEGRLALLYVFIFVHGAFADDKYSLIHSSYAFWVFSYMFQLHIHTFNTDARFIWSVSCLTLLIIGDFFELP